MPPTNKSTTTPTPDQFGLADTFAAVTDVMLRIEELAQGVRQMYLDNGWNEQIAEQLGAHVALRMIASAMPIGEEKQR